MILKYKNYDMWCLEDVNFLSWAEIDFKDIIQKYTKHEIDSFWEKSFTGKDDKTFNSLRECMDRVESNLFPIGRTSEERYDLDFKSPIKIKMYAVHIKRVGYRDASLYGDFTSVYLLGEPAYILNNDGKTIDKIGK